MASKQPDTEEKIKEAARVIFTKKGYAATRTRDIAEEAGINLSLLNYYFRSKEKLFHIIMEEKIQQLFGVMFPIVNDASLKLEEKVEKIVVNYITVLQKNSDLPIFVLNEIKTHPKNFAEKIGIQKVLDNSSLVNQLLKKRSDVNPVHFILSLLGMTVFPFISKPVFMASGLIDDKTFNQLMDERKKLIPIWLRTMLKG